MAQSKTIAYPPPGVWRMVLVGYGEGRKAYHLLNPENCTITISRDVKFDETSVIDNSMKPDDGPSEMELRIKLNGQAFGNDAADDEVIIEDDFQDLPLLNSK